MKKYLFFLVLVGLLVAGSAGASSYPQSSGSVHVDGYVRRDGTYVQPHYRSAPDGNPYNNYGSGN